MLTPDAPDRVYSTRLRTALVLTGTGTSGAYHAGVLRALHEAGVKLDLVAGRGIGAMGAMFAAVDGSARLWEPGGVWKAPDTPRFYEVRTPLRIAGWALAAGGVLLAIPVVLLALAVLLAMLGLVLTLIGLGAFASSVTTAYTSWVAALFAPAALPTAIPRLVLLAVLVALAVLGWAALATFVGAQRRRRAGHGILGRVFNGPLGSATLLGRCRTELWNLIRGAAAIATPPPAELGRHYIELLTDNQGQPGFRELLLVVHDLDARQDLVFALLGQKVRGRFFGRPPVAGVERPLDALDLAGPDGARAVDALCAALAIPVAADPHLMTFAVDSAWKGETHRLCDRPDSLRRLLDEVAATGAEQVVLVSAEPPSAKPHELSASRADVRGRAGEQLAAFEAASLRDAVEHVAGRFPGLFVVRPAHNPLGPLDFDGAYDARSDRRFSLQELMDRGYEDAYRQFIEPVVGASGDRIASVQP